MLPRKYSSLIPAKANDSSERYTAELQKVQACHYHVRYLEPHYGERNFIKERLKSQYCTVYLKKTNFTLVYNLNITQEVHRSVILLNCQWFKYKRWSLKTTQMKMNTLEKGSGACPDGKGCQTKHWRASYTSTEPVQEDSWRKPQALLHISCLSPSIHIKKKKPLFFCKV